MNTSERTPVESLEGIDSAYLWLALRNIPGVGNVMFGRMLETFGHWKAYFVLQQMN